MKTSQLVQTEGTLRVPVCSYCSVDGVLVLLSNETFHFIIYLWKYIKMLQARMRAVAPAAALGAN